MNGVPTSSSHRFHDSANADFSADHDRSNLTGLAGDAEARARLFSH